MGFSSHLISILGVCGLLGKVPIGFLLAPIKAPVRVIVCEGFDVLRIVWVGNCGDGTLHGHNICSLPARFSFVVFLELRKRTGYH